MRYYSAKEKERRKYKSRIQEKPRAQDLDILNIIKLRIELDGQAPSQSYVASSLVVSPRNVNQSVQRLINAGMLVTKDHGIYGPDTRVANGNRS